jgi:hypothetical protein
MALIDEPLMPVVVAWEKVTGQRINPSTASRLSLKEGAAGEKLHVICAGRRRLTSTAEVRRFLAAKSQAWAERIAARHDSKRVTATSTAESVSG